MCLLLETKLQIMDEAGVISLWGNKEVEWAVKWAQGRPEGLLIMWKAWLFTINLRFVGEGFVGIKLE